MHKILTFVMVSTLLFCKCDPLISLESIDNTNNSSGIEFKRTLNGFGEHFSNLGITEDKFYAFCDSLDKDVTIKRPIVAIFGGAYGFRAANVLVSTKRVTVVLNDLDDRHFSYIRRFQEENKHRIPYNRLILVGGSFFNIHKSQNVKQFFKKSPIWFHGILAANVFHCLNPEEFVTGLEYMVNSLAPSGEGFLMNMRPLFREMSEDACQYFANSLVLYKSFASQPETKAQQEAFKTAMPALSQIITVVQDALTDIIYEFNRSNGIRFPGYFYNSPEILQPNYFKLGESFFIGDPANRDHFLTTPEEVREWSQIVGFECLSVMDIALGSFPKAGSTRNYNYYFMHLKKSSQPNQKKSQPSRNDNLKNLIAEAQKVKVQIQVLHRGNAISITGSPPYFGIIDQSTKRYVAHITLPQVAQAGQAPLEGSVEEFLKTYEEMVLNGDESAIIQLAHYFYSQNNLTEAKFYCRLGSYLDVEMCQSLLTQIKQAGNEPGEPAGTETTDLYLSKVLIGSQIDNLRLGIYLLMVRQDEDYARACFNLGSDIGFKIFDSLMSKMNTQEIRAQEIDAREIEAQDIKAQGVRVQGIKAQEMRAQEIIAPD